MNGTFTAAHVNHSIMKVGINKVFKHHPDWMMLLILLVASALAIPHLSSTLTYDEAYTFTHFAQSPAQALLLYSVPNNHLLYSFLMWLSQTTIGTAELSLRLPAVAVTLLATALIYRLGRCISGSRIVGYFAALLLVTNPGVLTYASLARGYNLSILLGLLLVYLALYTPRRHYGVLLCTSALVMTLPSMLLLIGAIGLWALFYKRQLVMPIIVGTICGMLFYIPSLLENGLSFYANFTPSTIQQLATEFFDLAFGSWIYAFLLGLSISVWVLSKPFDQASILLLIILVSAILLVPVQKALLGSVFFGRNYIYLLPFVCLLAALGLGARTLLPIPEAIVVLAVAGLGLWTFYQMPTDTEIVEILVEIEALNEPDALVLGCCVNVPVWYYLDYSPDLLLPQGSDSIYVVETVFENIETLAEQYSFNTSSCQIYDVWAGYQVYLCE